MRGKFTHLSLMERELLFAWREKGESLRTIAKRLHRSHATLSREWQRNTKYFHSYLPCMAQKRYERISGAQRRGASLKNPFLFLGGAIEVHRELFIRPVGPVKPTILGAFLDPLLQGAVTAPHNSETGD